MFSERDLLFVETSELTLQDDFHKP